MRDALVAIGAMITDTASRTKAMRFMAVHFLRA
jgi:hypothetical protein